MASEKSLERDRVIQMVLESGDSCQSQSHSHSRSTKKIVESQARAKSKPGVLSSTSPPILTVKDLLAVESGSLVPPNPLRPAARAVVSGTAPIIPSSITTSRPADVETEQERQHHHPPAARPLPLSNNSSVTTAAAAAANSDSNSSSTMATPPRLMRGGGAESSQRRYQSTPGAFRVSGSRSDSNYDIVQNESWNHDDHGDDAINHSFSWNPYGGEADIEIGNNTNITIPSSNIEGRGIESNGSGPVVAIPVKDASDERLEIENEVRETILKEAVQASELSSEDPKQHCLTKPSHPVVICAMLVFVVAVAAAIAIGLKLTGEKPISTETSTSTSTSTATENDQTAPMSSLDAEDIVASCTFDDDRPTVEIIEERGHVLCGISDLGLAYASNDGGNLGGLSVEYCRAMALVALGNKDKYEVVKVTPKTRFPMLACGMVDVLTEGVTFTMGRDFYEATTMTGYSFTTPFFYTGLSFAGLPRYVDCAERQQDFVDGCDALKICVGVQTTHHDVLVETLSGGVFVLVEDMSDLTQQWHSGACNVIAGEPLFLAKAKEQLNLRDENEWKTGNQIVSRQPLSIVSRQRDPRWATLADLVVNAFIFAAAHSISSSNADDIKKQFMVDDDSLDVQKGKGELPSLLVSLISEFGHNGDLYNAHITHEFLLPRSEGFNQVYDQDATNGLLSSYPFGNLNESGPGPVLNGTLESILKRGYLICGVMPSRGAWFASMLTTRAETKKIVSIDSDEWVGFDVDFCRGVAASLFRGDDNKIVFVELSNNQQPYIALSNKEVDVVAGSRMNMQAMYMEPTSGQSFAFSTPYYYDNENHDAFAFMTLQDDRQWADFVKWIVMATIHAEEHGITSEAAPQDMPVVNLFGESNLKQLFMDCIYRVGNYGDLYARNLQDWIPRSGANLLSQGLNGPQLFPIALI